MNRRYYKIVQSRIIYFFSLWFTVNSSALTPVGGGNGHVEKFDQRRPSRTQKYATKNY